MLLISHLAWIVQVGEVKRSSFPDVLVYPLDTRTLIRGKKVQRMQRKPV